MEKPINEIIKEAKVTWGLKIGPKSNQREQNAVLEEILTQTLLTQQTAHEEAANALLEFIKNHQTPKSNDPYSNEYEHGYDRAMHDVFIYLSNKDVT